MLEGRSLTKYYSHIRAVHHVSFTIMPGEILGYLGHNGAGKSTTIRMLTGLVEPSEGQVLYKGQSIYDDLRGYQHRIGYVPEEAYLYPHLSGREYLQLVGRLRGMPRRSLDPKMDELLRLFGLWDDRFAPLSSYSKGMRQKILLSAALLHNPDILILDEPFSGLDVTSALVLRQLLGGLARREKIILYSSHVLEVVEKICTKVLILRKGEVVAYDSITQLRELMRQPSLEGVFAQLVQVDDGTSMADRILDVVTQNDVRIGTESFTGPAGATTPVPLMGERNEGRGKGSASDAYKAKLEILPTIRRCFNDLYKDFRHSLRLLANSPGFTSVALLSLSIGICIATCALSEMNGITLRKVPAVGAADELTALQMPISYPTYKRYKTQTDLFSSTTAYVAAVPFDLSLRGDKQRVWGQLTTPSYFSTLRVGPIQGRVFDDGDEQANETPPVVVSYRFWQEHFPSESSIVGKTMRINAHSAVIVGVTPQDFLGASPLLFSADIWLPLSAGEQVAPELANDALERNDRLIFRIVGRLNNGISMARAENELDGIAQQFAQENGDYDRNRKVRRVVLVEGGKLLPLREQDLPFFTSLLTVLAGLVMLIACANVANMMLARAAKRQKEIAIRLAIGATRSRIIRQLLSESILISIGAAVPGFLCCMWLMHLLSQVRMPFLIPVTFDFQPDARVLVMTILLTLITGIAFGLVPALQATNTKLAPALKDTGHVQPRRLRYLSPRNVLIVCQFVGSLTLLVIIGVLSLGIQGRMGIRAGFNPENLYLISLDPVRDGYSGEQAADFFGKLRDRASAMARVTGVTVSESVPVSLSDGTVEVSTAASDGRLTQSVMKHVIGRDYFAVTGIPVLLGREFRKNDEDSDTTAVVVNAELAREFWNSQDPLGRQLEIGNDQLVPDTVLPGSYDYRLKSSPRVHKVLEIVGVVNNVSEGLVESKPRPALYLPLRRDRYAEPPPGGFALMVRALPGVDVIGAVRHEVSVMDSNITLLNSRSMHEQIAQFVSPLRVASWTYALIGVFGLVLSSIGLAGMTAYSVALRGREIGIRRALGATSSNVLGLIMKEGLILVTTGMLFGSVGAWAGTRMLAALNSSVGQVTATSASDPAVAIGAPLLLGALTLLACYLPARKSVQIDPLIALREE